MRSRVGINPRDCRNTTLCRPGTADTFTPSFLPKNDHPMITVHPYLHFNGNCEEAFLFYKSVFGTDFTMIQRYEDVPAEQPFPEHDFKKIMHISLPLGKETILMGSDVPGAFPQALIGSNFYISLHPDNEEETRTLYDKLSAGGLIAMPIGKTFWSELFGMFVDKFGVQWMISLQ